jgi:hypothetical protein
MCCMKKVSALLECIEGTIVGFSMAGMCHGQRRQFPYE